MDELLPHREFNDGLTKGQRIFLWVYLVIHALVLPLALSFVTAELQKWMSDAYINFCYYAFGAVLVFIVTRTFFRRGFDVLCDAPLACVYAVLLGYMLVMALSFLASAVISVLPDALGKVDNLNNDYVMDLADSDYGVTSAMAIFLAPMVEEPLFRGGVFGSIRRRSRVWAYVASITLFAVYHVWQYALVFGDPLYLLMGIEYIPAGLALCWAYDRTGSIWSPVFLHALINAMSLLALQTTQSQ
jgi:membrane protease YdiL (CAAX protease family)